MNIFYNAHRRVRKQIPCYIESQFIATTTVPKTETLLPTAEFLRTEGNKAMLDSLPTMSNRHQVYNRCHMHVC